MHNDILFLTGTAATLGFLHTLAGPDHYLPFIVMAKARQWSIPKTVLITVLCGLGHVGSSMAIGALGLAFGLGVAHLEVFEGHRGCVAAWLFILFGLVYFLWGLYRAIWRPGRHHLHLDGTVHAHRHSAEHQHEAQAEPRKSITPWILFTVFVFGPCEPLIPVLMYPAAQQSTAGVIGVGAVFSAATLLTMVALVLIPLMGLKMLPTRLLERSIHAVAGFTLLACGIGMAFLGM